MELSRNNEHLFFELCKIEVPDFYLNTKLLTSLTSPSTQSQRRNYEERELMKVTNQIKTAYQKLTNEIYDNNLSLDIKQWDLYLNNMLRRAKKELNEINADNRVTKNEYANDDFYLYKFDFIYQKVLCSLQDLIENLEDQLQTVKGKEHKTAIEPPANDSLNFSVYLNEKGKPLLSKLKELYSDEKPMIICCMLLALSNLACLTSNLDTANKTQLHRALEQSFGKIGTRQSLSDNLNKLRTDYYKTKVDTCKKKIAALIKKS